MLTVAWLHLFQECLLSDGHHLGREDFLTQLMAYTSITHHALLHPTAVFFDKVSLLPAGRNPDSVVHCVCFKPIPDTQ